MAKTQKSVRSAPPDSGEASATQKTTLRLPIALWKAASHRAIDDGITLQTLVERAIEGYLATGGKP